VEAAFGSEGAAVATAAPAPKDARNLDDPWGGDAKKPATAPKRALDSAEPWK
jgi:hypothetical protein